MTEFRLSIDGKLVEGASTLDVINPATGRIFAAAPRANQAQLEQAVGTAKTRSPRGRRNHSRNGGRCSSSWPKHSKRSRTPSPAS